MSVNKMGSRKIIRAKKLANPIDGKRSSESTKAGDNDNICNTLC